jgi:hypothetical protein
MITPGKPVTDPALLIKDEMAAIRNYLNSVADILKSGYMPDITGLGPRVAALCESLRGAKPEIQQQCMAEFSDLLKRMDACEDDMHEFNKTRMKS